MNKKAPFATEHRLRTRKQRDFVRHKGRSKAGRYCVVAAVRAPDQKLRWGTVISRKYSPKAVVRNRARRLFREAWRQLFPTMGEVWVIFIPRWRMQTARFQQVLSEIQQLAAELELFRTDECSCSPEAMEE